MLKLNIVYFSSIDWNFTWQRPQQLASRLSRYGNVLYISPFGLRSVSPKDLPRIVRRVIFCFADKTNLPSSETLTVYTPLLYLPFPESTWASRVNGRLMRSAIESWMNRLGISAPVLWVGTPSAAVLEAISTLKAKSLIYDCLDNFGFFHNQSPTVFETERRLASRAQFVFATADELYARMKQINPQTFLVPNAADFDHFQKSMDKHSKPPNDIAEIAKPLLGYIGELADWFDFDLIQDLAVQNPDWSIVLIGVVHTRAAHKILNLPNVHYLGRKSYAELPAYLSQFDVCLLPFKINPLTSSVNPVKLYEYLASGKPIVSTPLKEVMRYRDVLEVAERAEFSNAVRAALETGNEPSRIRQRLKIAKCNTWEERIQEIIRILRLAS